MAEEIARIHQAGIFVMVLGGLFSGWRREKEIIGYMKFKYDRNYSPYRALSLPVMVILLLLLIHFLFPGVLGPGQVASRHLSLLSGTAEEPFQKRQPHSWTQSGKSAFFWNLRKWLHQGTKGDHLYYDHPNIFLGFQVASQYKNKREKSLT